MKCYQRLWYIEVEIVPMIFSPKGAPPTTDLSKADLLPTVTSPLTGAISLLSAATLTHRLISFATYMYGIFESLCDILQECISKSLRKFLNPCFDASVLFGGVSG
jgi:hypothetical protein